LGNHGYPPPPDLLESRSCGHTTYKSVRSKDLGVSKRRMRSRFGNGNGFRGPAVWFVKERAPYSYAQIANRTFRIISLVGESKKKAVAAGKRQTPGLSTP
jgi:hypothetical protein